MTPNDQPKSPLPLDYATPQLNRRMDTGMKLLTIVLVAMAGLFIAALLLPALSTVRDNPPRLRCASNLKQIGTALIMYNNDYRSYPNCGGNSSPTRSDIAGTLFMLVRHEDLTTAIFCCRQTDAVPDTANPLTATNFAVQNDTTLSYALTNPNYRPSQGGFRWSASMSADWAVAADGNYPFSSTNPNSSNHNGDGQNVLYNDGHVDWFTNLMAGKLSTGAADDITTCNGIDPQDTQVLPLDWRTSPRSPRATAQPMSTAAKVNIVGIILLLGVAAVVLVTIVRRRAKSVAR
jgi:hypothetical protein